MTPEQETHKITHNKSQGLIDYAYRFARDAHKGQLRKYTGDAYIEHPIAVAKVVASVTDDCDMIAAAFLHDTVEDTWAENKDIIEAFGQRVAMFVNELTQFSVSSDGNRAIRKELDARYLSRVSIPAKTIKIADLIHNSESIMMYGGDFASVYIKEMEHLLNCSLFDGNSELLSKAKSLVREYKC